MRLVSKFATYGLGLGLMVCAIAPTIPAQSQLQPNTYPGVTRPTEERSLNFGIPGVVRKVLVKEGQDVKAGDVLMELDDRMEQKALEAMLIEANSQLKIEYSKLDLAQKEVVLKRFLDLNAKKYASPSELEEAQLGRDRSDASLRLSVEELLTKKLEADKQKIKVELAKLVSTIDGQVQKLGIKDGEVADPNQVNRPACIVVKNDPLKVEVFLPTAIAATLKMNQELEVQYPGSDKWLPAKVYFFDPVADAGAGMRRLNLELPNPEKRESGWKVQVRLRQP